MTYKPFRPDHTNPVMSKDGINHISRCRCVDCKAKKRIQSRGYYHGKHEENRIKKRAYVAANREHVDNYQKQYREAHKGELKAWGKKHREENKEAINAQRAEYRENNRELINERQKVYYQENREERLAYAKMFRDEKMHPLYKLWDGIRYRCLNENATPFKSYGNPKRIHPVTMYGPWVDSFLPFAEYIEKNLGPKPGPEYSLDRIDNNRGYEPGNLRWATKKEQANNTRKNRNYRLSIPDDSPIYYPYGELITLKEFAEKVEMPLIIAKYRYAMFWDPDYILKKDIVNRFIPVGKHQYSFVELEIFTGISASVLRTRILKLGWPIEKALKP